MRPAPAWGWIARAAQLGMVICAFFVAFHHGEDSGGFRVLALDFSRNLGGQVACAVLVADSALLVASIRLGRASAARMALLIALPLCGLLYLLMALRLGADAVPDRAPQTLCVWGTALAIAVARIRR